MQRAYGTVKLKVGRISSLCSSLSPSKTESSYVNHALEDDRGSYTLFIYSQQNCEPANIKIIFWAFRAQQGIPAVE